MNFSLLVALLLALVAALVHAEERALRMNCAPHPKMSKQDCTTCINHGAKLHWVGTGKGGKGGCQYRPTPTPSLST